MKGKLLFQLPQFSNLVFGTDPNPQTRQTPNPGNLEKNLSKFFVTEEDLAEMQVLETEFRAAIPRKRIADSVSKVSTQNIAEVFDAVDQLLKEELDLLMAPFEFTEPDFYRACKKTRIIVNYPGGGQTPEEPETEEPQPES